MELVAGNKKEEERERGRRKKNVGNQNLVK
jgi:hypothetical protein